jgi:hypothetical protein
MAAFARGPDITARISDVIEYLQSDAVQEHAELNAELDATALLKELNRLLTTNQAGADRGKLEALIRHVRAGRGEILSGDRALALKRFKEARDGWMAPAKKGDNGSLHSVRFGSNGGGKRCP